MIQLHHIRDNRGRNTVVPEDDWDSPSVLLVEGLAIVNKDNFQTKYSVFRQLLGGKATSGFVPYSNGQIEGHFGDQLVSIQSPTCFYESKFAPNIGYRIRFGDSSLII